MSFKQLLTFRLLELLLYLEKSCEVRLFRSLLYVSENTPKIISIGPPITEKRPFKKLKIFPFWRLLFQKYLHFQFSISQIFRQRVTVSENLTCKSQLLWNYGPSNLLFRFRYRLGHLNNRQTKIVENSKKHFFFKANTKTTVWWKFQILWHNHYKTTVL